MAGVFSSIFPLVVGINNDLHLIRDNDVQLPISPPPSPPLTPPPTPPHSHHSYCQSHSRFNSRYQPLLFGPDFVETEREYFYFRPSYPARRRTVRRYARRVAPLSETLSIDSDCSSRSLELLQKVKALLERGSNYLRYRTGKLSYPLLLV